MLPRTLFPLRFSTTIGMKKIYDFFSGFTFIYIINCGCFAPRVFSSLASTVNAPTSENEKKQGWRESFFVRAFLRPFALGKYSPLPHLA